MITGDLILIFYAMFYLLLPYPFLLSIALPPPWTLFALIIYLYMMMASVLVAIFSLYVTFLDQPTLFGLTLLFTLLPSTILLSSSLVVVSLAFFLFLTNFFCSSFVRSFLCLSFPLHFYLSQIAPLSPVRGCFLPLAWTPWSSSQLWANCQENFRHSPMLNFFFSTLLIVNSVFLPYTPSCPLPFSLFLPSLGMIS